MDWRRHALFVIFRVKGGIFRIKVGVQVGGEFLHALLGGERRKHHVHGVAGQARRLVYLRHGLQVRNNLVEYVIAKLLVGVFTAAEAELEPDFMPVVQEAFRTGQLHVVIVRVRPDAELDFLEPDRAALVGFLELGLLVLVPSIVHHAAHGRIGIACHFHQVQANGFGLFQRVTRIHYPELVAIGRHHAHAWSADAFIDTGLITALTAAITIIILRWLDWHVRILLN